jgi:sialate O-acetylesterase
VRLPAAEEHPPALRPFRVATDDASIQAAVDSLPERGGTVYIRVVSSDKVPNPVAVRYAFAMNPQGANLYNQEGFPASPFRTDRW